MMDQSLENKVVQCLSWSGVQVAVPDRQSKGMKTLVEDVSGDVRAGEMLAIMGPSGSGKTTLLNVLAHRPVSSRARVTSSIMVNKQNASKEILRQLSRFVESEDVLLGALTVSETLYFAAQLGLGSDKSGARHAVLIQELLSIFGLSKQADTIVGTFLKIGISTGQKRRLSVATQLISAPRILFLDEPTSGLDSAASFKVISYLKDITRALKLVVVCSIHQPSSAVFEQFDKLLLMSGGKTCYSGPVKNTSLYFAGIGYPLPRSANAAEFVLDLVNIDFDHDLEAADASLTKIQECWGAHSFWSSQRTLKSRDRGTPEVASLDAWRLLERNSTSIWTSTRTIIHRNWIKSHRDMMVYGARLVMYLGLAILMGTIWLRIQPRQEAIVPLTHCILFGASFMSFMAVVYVPAFVEDFQLFTKDRDNSLYGGTAFLLSNFVVGLPYLFTIAVTFSSVAYWMINFRPDGTAFMFWVLWTYLNLLAAESLVVLVSVLFPNFIGALAVFAMLNSIFMTCNGFMVPRAQLNVFYRYVFYYADYQGYVYRGLSKNEFGFREYTCGQDCMVKGTTVLQGLGFENDRQVTLVGTMLGIIATIRLLAWLTLMLKR